MNGDIQSIKKEWLTLEQCKNPDVILDEIKEFVEDKGQGTTTSQLRNIYDIIIKIEDKDVNKAKLIRPKIVYAAAKKAEGKNFMMYLHDLLKEVDDEIQFKNYKLVFEAIVAYHKNKFNN